MDQNKARSLLREGAILVLLDVPEGTEMGIDLKVWNTEENFRGFKMIPPGLHFIFYSCVSKTEDIAPRRGFFHNFKKSEFLVKKWNKGKEDLCLEEVDNKEVVGLKDNYIALDKFLGPYPFEIHKRWSALISHITTKVLDRHNPIQGKIMSAIELIPCSDADRPRGIKKTANLDSAGCSSSSSSDSNTTVNYTNATKRSRLSCPSDLEQILLPNLKPVPGSELRFTPFPSKVFPEGCTPSEITKHCLDLTYTLENMLTSYDEPSEIIGELQFCYVCFLVGHSLEAFEQWKKLVGLLCSCETAIKKYRQVFDLFVTVLEAQLREIPEEFLADIVANSNYIYVKLKNFFGVVEESDIDGRLKTKIDRFKNSIKNFLKWDFSFTEREDDDDAPVIVETT
ncbi:protein AAR2 homolog [Agrilus planipennis]|uniref:Protein AAR2 homolog n=1 Tax=Agrilus planipennis TaxID=224129 RepID=A0A1W4XD50_AGRPL|nr:protein AAR2 homolog [Agrilus planipennis]